MKLYIITISILLSPFIVLSQAEVDDFSLSSLFVRSFNKATPLKNATGFLMNINSKNYFITNEHVVGGIFFVTQYKNDYKSEPPLDSLPDRLIIRLYDNQLNRGHLYEIPLFNKSYKQNWINFYEDETSKTGLLDVVAIPLNIDQSIIGKSSVLRAGNQNQNLAIFVGQELYVVGFPMNTADQIMYPIWKRGTIASEPNITSQFNIDATTRAGMSGSPVFFRSPVFINKQGQFSIGALAQPPIPVYTYLVGIYNSQALGLELGGVIKIDKVIAALSKIQ